MTDTQLKYFYAWNIIGPDSEVLVKLRESPPPIEKEKLDDIDYLCERFEKYPEATLGNNDVAYKVGMLRQKKELKDKTAADSLKKICKAIYGDGRGKKISEEYIEEFLKPAIRSEIRIFKEILKLIAGGNTNHKDAIMQIIRRKDEYKNYEKFFYAYKRVYDKLKEKMSEVEIFCFFNMAADKLNYPNAIVDVFPDNRGLTFVKKKTWGIYGSDLNETVIRNSLTTSHS